MKTILAANCLPKRILFPLQYPTRETPDPNIRYQASQTEITLYRNQLGGIYANPPAHAILQCFLSPPVNIIANIMLNTMTITSITNTLITTHIPSPLQQVMSKCGSPQFQRSLRIKQKNLSLLSYFPKDSMY